MTNSAISPIPTSSLRTALKDWVVLIVDDHPDNLVVAKIALKFQGATIHTATNGEEGLSVLQNIAATLILLDLSMPVMDGWEMFRQVRSNPKTQSLPIIALTAHAMEGDRERAMNAGFTGYIVKPFDVTTLVERIQGILLQTATLSIATSTSSNFGSLSTSVKPAQPIGTEVSLTSDSMNDLDGVDTTEIKAIKPVTTEPTTSTPTSGNSPSTRGNVEVK